MMLFPSYLSKSKTASKQQQRTVKPVTQIAAQLPASCASRCAGRYVSKAGESFAIFL